MVKLTIDPGVLDQLQIEREHLEDSEGAYFLNLTNLTDTFDQSAPASRSIVISANMSNSRHVTTCWQTIS